MVTKKTVLVVGDWIVDEHVIVGHDRSTTASRRGEVHYHALHELDSSVEALCGAGIVASLIGEAETMSGLPLFDVHGIGAWHPDDQEELEAMQSHDGLDRRSSYRIARPKVMRHTVHLHNVCRADDPVVTTRAQRVYVEEGGELRHLYRLDWARMPPRKTIDHKPAWLASAEDVSRWWPNAELANLHPDAIVIKDLVKGVVSRALIERLVEAFRGLDPKPRWYVSSKEWHLERPDRTIDEWRLRQGSWLELLADEDVRLLVVPQVAADHARKEHNINAWSIRSGDPSRHALLLMDALVERLGARGTPDVAVLPDAQAMFLRTVGNAKPQLIVWPQVVKDSKLRDGAGRFVPLASVVFAGLVAHMENATPVSSAATVLPNAIGFANDWVAAEAQRFEAGAEWRPSGAHKSLLVPAHAGALSDGRDWETELARWHQAREKTGLGIVDPDTDPRIELWRAATDVAEYICLVPQKREAVRSLKRELLAFRDQRPRSRVSLLLESEPGAGKTFLLGRIADELGVNLVKYNVAQWTTLSEVLATFDDIISRQAQDPDKPLVVFVDEINAQVDGTHVYQLFLDPLAEGTYARGGRRFSIQPCAWVFAGTGIEDGLPATKGSDFKSRLSLPPLQFVARKTRNTRDDEEEIAALERVYVGTANILRYLPDIKYATAKALSSFKLLPPRTSFRDQERFVQSFSRRSGVQLYAADVDRRFIDGLWDQAERRAETLDQLGVTSSGEANRLKAQMKKRKHWEEDRHRADDELPIRLVR